MKDVRTGEQTSNVGAVLDGDIGNFIDAYLQALARGTLKSGGAASDDEEGDNE